MVTFLDEYCNYDMNGNRCRQWNNIIYFSLHNGSERKPKILDETRLPCLAGCWDYVQTQPHSLLQFGYYSGYSLPIIFDDLNVCKSFEIKWMNKQRRLIKVGSESQSDSSESKKSFSPSNPTYLLKSSHKSFKNFWVTLSDYTANYRLDRR